MSNRFPIPDVPKTPDLGRARFDLALKLRVQELEEIVRSLVNVKATDQATTDIVTGTVIPGSSYAHYLAASLEPDAIEKMQKGTFSYAVGASETKLLLASWSTRLGSSGRMEARNPQRVTQLRDCTLTGLSAASSAIIIDPTIPTYSNAWDTYYSRLLKIAELPTKNITITAVSQHKPMLPGAYGAIITQITCFDLAWIILLQSNTYGPNLWDEISDSATQRVGDTLAFPVSKITAGEIQSASTGSSPLGSVSYVLLPSDWSVVPDPVSSSYSFRDDFMGSILDSGVWSKTESVAGNIQIDTDYQWCKIKGDQTWGHNSMMVTNAMTRAEGMTMVCDVFCARLTTNQGVCVEWNNGSGYAQSNGAHRVEFGGSYNLYVIENGTVRSTTANGWSIGSIYRVKIVLHAGGSASYYIQGGKEYPAIGGTTWTNITPGTSNSANNSLHPSAGAYGIANYYISDMKVYTP